MLFVLNVDFYTNDLIESNYCKINVFKNAFRFEKKRQNFVFLRLHILKKNDEISCFYVCTSWKKTKLQHVSWNVWFLSEYIVTYKLKRFVRNLFLRTNQRNKNKTIYLTICFNVVWRLYFVRCETICFTRNLLYVAFVICCMCIHMFKINVKFSSNNQTIKLTFRRKWQIS